MTEPTPADLLAAPGAETCGASCACHGGYVCQRPPHPHEPGNVMPHLGRDPDGQLVQWAHTDEHGPMLTAKEAAELAAETRRAHTRALFADLDPDVIRELLK